MACLKSFLPSSEISLDLGIQMEGLPFSFFMYARWSYLDLRIVVKMLNVWLDKPWEKAAVIVSVETLRLQSAAVAVFDSQFCDNDIMIPVAPRLPVLLLCPSLTRKSQISNGVLIHFGKIKNAIFALHNRLAN